ncbi:MAG: ABC transporter permease subunit [Alicyclobacillaceae bacterium]|nr:ABC transporter permease subunit [Alicyclobacillaceae bacterium]
MRTALTLSAALLAVFLAFPFLVLIFVAPWFLYGSRPPSGIAGALATSLTAAAEAAGVGMVLGTAVGYHLSQHRFPGKEILERLIRLPALLPHAAVGMALVAAYGGPGSFPQPGTAVVLALVFVSLPVAVGEAKAAFDRVEPRFKQAARCLGAGSGKVFWTVTLPLAAGDLVGAAALTFGRAFGEFAVPLLFAPDPATASVEVYRLFREGQFDPSATLAVWTILVSLISYGLFFGVRFLVGHRLGRSGR